MKYLGLWSRGLQIFFEKFVKPLGPPSYILNVRSLIWYIYIYIYIYIYSCAVDIYHSIELLGGFYWMYFSVNLFWKEKKCRKLEVTLFNKEPMVNYEVTRRYRVSKFVKLGDKNCKFKVFGHYEANYYCTSSFPLSKIGFFLAVREQFFHWMIFLNSRYFKKIS